MGLFGTFLPSVQAGEWIPNSKDCFATFQKALREGDAKGIWEMLAPESQRAADAVAQMLCEKYARLSGAEKAKVEAVLKLSAAKVSKLTGTDLVGSKAFREFHSALILAAKLSPERTKDGIEMKYEVNGTSGQASMMSLSGDKRNYKMILAMPNVPASD
jgi:hypothetical protein